MEDTRKEKVISTIITSPVNTVYVNIDNYHDYSFYSSIGSIKITVTKEKKGNGYLI